MILIVGGQGTGKREYARSLGFADDASVLADLHLFLRDNPADPEALLPDLLRKQVIICNEIGCGIVPMDEAERAWRDRVGRMCALLAKRAEKVVRLCCGIPMVIKDTGA